MAGAEGETLPLTPPPTGGAPLKGGRVRRFQRLFTTAGSSTSTPTSRLRLVFGALVGVVVVSMAHFFYVSQAQAAALQKYRRAADADGDHKLNKSEVAAWFSEHMGGGGAGKGGHRGGDRAKFEKLVSQFDSDGDDVFSDGELKEFFDAMDEFPTVVAANVDVAVLGGDYLESQQFCSVGIVMVLTALLLKLKSAIDQSDSEYRKAKDEVAQSQRNLATRQGEVASLESDLVRQREEVARLAELHVEGVSRSASSEKTLQEARKKLG